MTIAVETLGPIGSPEKRTFVANQAGMKRGLAVVTDAEWENIPDVGNLTRRKRRREERSFAVPDSIIVGDRGKGEYENALDSRQQVCYTSTHGL